MTEYWKWNFRAYDTLEEALEKMGEFSSLFNRGSRLDMSTDGRFLVGIMARTRNRHEAVNLFVSKRDARRACRE